MYSWKIKIDKNKLLDVKVNASFSNTFNKEELKQIQTDAYHKIYVLR